MKNYFLTAKAYGIEHKKDFIMGASLAIGVALLVALVLSVMQNTRSKVVYQPANACSLFTPAEARSLLGDKTLRSNTTSPVVSGNLASSRCGYTDGNPDTNSMIVAAVIVRSGVNDKGIEQNKAEFTAGKPDTGITEIKGVGDSAYFNQRLGQLNVLHGREWILLSYGQGSAPESNTEEQAVALARKVLQ